MSRLTRSTKAIPELQRKGILQPPQTMLPILLSTVVDRTSVQTALRHMTGSLTSALPS